MDTGEKIVTISKKRGRRGGRQKGTPNKKTQAVVAAIESSGLTPLEYMLQAMRDETNPVSVRLDAARNAAPYVHPRLTAIEVSGPNNGPIRLILNGSDIDG